MCVLLTETTPEMSDLFEEGKELMTFSSPEELIDKAGFLLKNRTVRMEMSNAVRRRALSEHTWEHRFKKVFNEMGLPVK